MFGRFRSSTTGPVAQATVKTHVNRVLTKLGVATRVQAVVLAYEHGVVRPGWPRDGVPQARRVRTGRSSRSPRESGRFAGTAGVARSEPDPEEDP